MPMLWVLLVAAVMSTCAADINNVGNATFTTTVYHVNMSDGVPLYTILLRPSTANGHPCAVEYQQTPYNGQLVDSLISGWYQGVNRMNVTTCFILQDIRGTDNSSGVFDQFRPCRRDAHDTVKWIRSQPWSNGVIFTTGDSAMGISAFVTADAEITPKLSAQRLGIATNNLRETLFPNGVYQAGTVDVMLGMLNFSSYIPVFEQHEGPSSWWDATTMNEYSGVNWPSVMTSGWSDVFVQASLQAFDGYRHHSNILARRYQFIGIAARGHCFKGGQPQWNVTEEYKAEIATYLLMDGLFVLLANATDPFTYDERVALWGAVARKYVPARVWFVQGPGLNGTIGGYTTSGEEFPTTVPVTYYLESDEGLTLSAPTGNTTLSTTYLSDPAHPVPTLGGATLLWNNTNPNKPTSIPCGAWDQLLLGNRSDILSFTSKPFTTDSVFMGVATIDLYVSSDAPDTDFFVKVEDVYPNNTRMLITDGQIRMRWRSQGATTDPPMTEGHVYKVTLETLPTCWVLNRGHRLGIDIDSSNNPRFSVNPGTGLPLVDGMRGMRVQKNTVHYGGKYPSKVDIPTAPVDQFPPWELPVPPPFGEFPSVADHLARRGL